MNTELLEAKEVTPQKSASVFNSIQAFEDAQRMVKPLASSQFIPENFRGRIDDCLIALEMAHRMGVSPMTVLQNTYIVHGKPGIYSQFLISLVNRSGYFASQIKYRMTGKKGTDSYGCIAWVKDKDGDTLEGPEVTIEMAKAEGWASKPGSKWKTMPEMMLRYRAATFFSRLYAPEITMGMKTQEEIIDVDSFDEQPKASRFDKPLLETEPQTPPPPPPAKKAEAEAEKDLTQDVTLFKELSFEEQLEITLKNLECSLTIDQVHELCKKQGVEFGSYLLHNEAQGLQTVLRNAGK